MRIFYLPLIFFIFILNGASVLGLELAWCKRLEQLLGVGLFAVTTVVSFFLLGMAIGSYFGARLRNCSVAHFAWIQAGSAIASLLFSIFIFSNLPYQIVGITRGSTSDLVGVIMIVPTFFMGMLLPAAAVCFKRIWHEQRADRTSGLAAMLYAYGLLGSLLGIGLISFWAMPAFGLWNSTLLAAALNFVCLIIALSFVVPNIYGVGTSGALSPSLPRTHAHAESLTFNILSPSAAKHPLHMHAAEGMLLLSVSGFVGMGMEILWTRLSSLIFGASVYSFALVLICYSLGSAIGAWVAARFFKNARRNLLALIFTPVAVGAYLYWQLFFFNDSPWHYLQLYKVLLTHFHCTNFSAGALSTTISLLVAELVPAFLLGAYFVIVLRLVDAMNRAGDVGYLAFANGIGGIAGAWAAGNLLIPWLSTAEQSGIQGSVGIFGMIVILLSIYALVRYWRSRAVTTVMRNTGAVCCAVVMIALVGLTPRWNAQVISLNVPNLCRMSPMFPNFLQSRSDLHNLAYKDHMDFYQEGLNSTVAIFSNRARNVSYMKIDGMVEGTLPIDWSLPCSSTDLPTHVLMAELPMLLSPSAQSHVCLIGYGTGTIAGIMLSHPAMKHLQIIELEKDVIQASQFLRIPLLSNAVRASLPSSGNCDTARCSLRLMDARYYMFNTHTTFDAIVSQPFDPWVCGSANLFTREYWKICRRRLTPGGIFCQWLQLYAVEPHLLGDLCRTFTSVFPNCALILPPGGGEVLLIATTESQPDICELYQRRCSGFRGNHPFLSYVGLNDPARLKSLLVLGPSEIGKWSYNLAKLSGDWRLNTDDNLLVEYALPRFYSDPEMCISSNLSSIYRYRKPSL